MHIVKIPLFWFYTNDKEMENHKAEAAEIYSICTGQN